MRPLEDMNELSEYMSSCLFITIIAMVLGYLSGSISFSILLTRSAGKQDIRTMGSGNAGFTNMLRSVGKKHAAITFIGDFIKAVIPIVATMLLFKYTTDNSSYTTIGKYICGLFCVIGHMFPAYFRLKGGKGVVTSAAVLLMTDYRVFLCVLTVFLIAFIATKIVSLGSVLGAFTCFISTLCFAFFSYYKGYSIFYVTSVSLIATIISALVVIKHRGNIVRIIRGEEKRITVKKE